jgi:hypothetical protein
MTGPATYPRADLLIGDLLAPYASMIAKKRFAPSVFFVCPG